MFSLRGAVLSFELSSGDAMALAYGQVNDQKVVSGDQSSSRMPVKQGRLVCSSSNARQSAAWPTGPRLGRPKTIKPGPPSQFTPQ
jgi:hypothetical protein